MERRREQPHQIAEQKLNVIIRLKEHRQGNLIEIKEQPMMAVRIGAERRLIAMQSAADIIRPTSRQAAYRHLARLFAQSDQHAAQVIEVVNGDLLHVELTSVVVGLLADGSVGRPE